MRLTKRRLLGGISSVLGALGVSPALAHAAASRSVDLFVDSVIPQLPLVA